MPAAARVGDHHTCPRCEPGPVPHVGGAILPTGATSVLIHGMPAARVGDRSKCNGPPDTIVMGESSVLIANSPAARVGDPTSHGGVIVAGCGCVQIGRLAQAIVMHEAAKSGAAFCEECARKKAAEEAKKRKGKKAAPQAATRKPPPAASPASHAAVPAGRNGRAVDVQRTLDHLNAAAHQHSTGWCARYVANAITAGGANFTRGNAKDCGPSLLRAGFQEVASTGDYPHGGFTPEPGDVVVFDPVPKHPYGHIAMWNGDHWVSDFHQKSFYVANGYTNGSFHVYRP